MRKRCAVLVTVLVTVLAACGGSSPTSGGGSGNPPPTANVTMLDYRFSPETVRVAVGSVVGWSNGGMTGHTSTSDAALWNSSAIAPPGPPPPTCQYPPCDGSPGGTFQHTFATAGTYPYHCMFHDSLGMKGVVVVTP
jgi:plastocyanin